MLELCHNIRMEKLDCLNIAEKYLTFTKRSSFFPIYFVGPLFKNEY